MQDVKEKVVVSLDTPTPMGVRKIVRALTWITAIYAIVSINVNFTDFGMSVATENLVLKYMATFTGLISMIARFLGVEPVKLDTDTPTPRY